MWLKQNETCYKTFEKDFTENIIDEHNFFNGNCNAPWRE